jgi:hypothetical protein
MSEEIICSNIQSKLACWCCNSDWEVVGTSIACDQTGYETPEGAIVTFEEYCVATFEGTVIIAADNPCG